MITNEMKLDDIAETYRPLEIFLLIKYYLVGSSLITSLMVLVFVFYYGGF
jgi:hypothetical protein